MTKPTIDDILAGSDPLLDVKLAARTAQSAIPTKNGSYAKRRRYLFCSLAQESRSEMVRLKTGFPGRESLGSARK